MHHTSSCRNSRLPFLILTIATAFLLAGTGLAQGTFVSFDGPKAGTGSGHGTFPVAINRWGGVALTTTDDTGIVRAYVRHPNGTYLEIQFPGALRTYVSGLNASGQVVGTYYNSSNQTPGFIRNVDGTYVTVNPPGSNGLVNLAGINDKGQVAGTANPGQPWEPFFWDPAQPDTYVIFNIPGGTFISAVAINDSGQIAGSYGSSSQSYGYLRNSDGTISSFALLPSITGADLQVNAMNKWGTILGSFFDENNITTDLLLRYSGGGQKYVVGAERGGFVPAAISDKGTVVGLEYADETTPAMAFAMDRSFNNIAIPIPSNAQSSAATGVNTAGQIVGAYVDANGVSHGWIYLP